MEKSGQKTISPPKKSSRKNENAQNDLFEYKVVIHCKECSLEKTFSDISEYLEHSASHKGKRGQYSCQFCSTNFMHSVSLKNHYLRKHDIPLPCFNLKDDQRPCRKIKQPSRFVEPMEEKNERKKRRIRIKKEVTENGRNCDNKEYVDRNSKLLSPHLANSKIAELLFTPSVEIINNVSSIVITNSASLFTEPLMNNESTSLQNVNGVSLTPAGAQLQEITEDFNFILHTEMVEGSSFQFAKQYLKCLHCEYKTLQRNDMICHMFTRHKDLLKVNQSIQINESDQNEHIMSMSVYTEAYSDENRETSGEQKSDDQSANEGKGKKKRKREKQDIPGDFSCKDCGKVFTRLRYLRKHAATHQEDRKFLCDTCGKGFKTKTYLNLHRKSHKDKMFHCNQCDFLSSINAAIHAHRQFHSEGSVLCDICGYAYNDKSTLAKHKQVHDPSRPFACTYPECSWRFKRESMCKAHIRAHSTEGKFRCNECGYVFRHKHHLIRHESKMHNIVHSKPAPENSTTASEETEKAPQQIILNTDKPVDINPENQVDDAESLASVEQLQLNTLGSYSQFVVTDDHGTPITYGTSDLPNMNIQALLQEGETRTIILPSQFVDEHVTSIVFQQDEQVLTSSQDVIKMD